MTVNCDSMDFKIWCVGSCDKDITTETTAGTLLMGGSTDVVEALQWQINNTNGGDFVLLTGI